MDPDATMQAINEDYLSDPESAILLCIDLQNWIRNGGFLPSIAPIGLYHGATKFHYSRSDFIAYLGNLCLNCQRRIDNQ
jgi:hypothetical protein